MYIYPDNLAAKATLWLWELKDLAIIGIGFLIGIFSLVRTGALLPLALVVAYGFLSIRFDNTSILVSRQSRASSYSSPSRLPI